MLNQFVFFTGFPVIFIFFEFIIKLLRTVRFQAVCFKAAGQINTKQTPELKCTYQIQNFTSG
jgi:hypothetical protein